MARTATQMRDTTQVQVLLDFFEDTATTEIYTIGWVLSYIFTGREALPIADSAVARIVRTCTTHDLANRYQSVRDLIVDVEQLTD